MCVGGAERARDRRGQSYTTYTPAGIRRSRQSTALQVMGTVTNPTVLVSIAELRWDSAWVTHNLPHFLLEVLVGGNVQLIVGNLLRVKHHFDFLLVLLDL